MAMQSIKKETEPAKVTASDIEKPVLKAIDKVAEDDRPFLKEESNGDITVMGDPKKVVPVENPTEYELTFVLPKADYNPADYENIVFENSDFFNIKTTATQEKVTPYNRTYLSSVAIDFVLTFFKVEGESIELKSDEDLRRASIELYRNDEVVENTKFFVGKLLGVDESLIPYINDLELPELAINLISANPTLINEAYFKVK